MECRHIDWVNLGLSMCIKTLGRVSDEQIKQVMRQDSQEHSRISRQKLSEKDGQQDSLVGGGRENEWSRWDEVVKAFGLEEGSVKEGARMPGALFRETRL